MKPVLSPKILPMVVIAWMAGCATTTPPPPKWTPLDTSSLSEPLTLQKCLELAQKNDIRAAQWQARMGTAKAELRQSKMLPNPTFSPSWDDVGLKDDTGVDLSNLTYGFSFPIFFWWPQSKKIEAAKANQMLEEAAIHSEQRQLAIEVAAAYFKLVADQRKVKLAEELLKISNESIRLVQKQNELGLVSDLNVEQARAERIKSESDLADFQSQLRLDQLAFAFALGADRPFYPVFADCGDECLHLPGIAAESESVSEEIVQAAVQSDPGYQEKKAATLYAAAQVHVEKRSAIPLADVAGSAGPKDAPEGTGSAYSLDIPIPIFDQNQAGIQRAESELQKAYADEEQARRDAVAAITQAWEQYRALAKKWNQFSLVLCQTADKNKNAAVKLFDAGRIPYSELLLAERDNQQAQLDAVADWQELSAAAWTLSCFLGKLELR